MDKDLQTTIEGNGGQKARAGGTAEKAAESAKRAAMQRVEAAQQKTGAARENAAQRIRGLGETVRKVGEQLRGEHQEYLAGRAAYTGDRIDELADYVGSTELRTMVRDTESWARQKPAIFFGSAFVLGLAAGRLLKNSSRGDEI